MDGTLVIGSRRSRFLLLWLSGRLFYASMRVHRYTVFPMENFTNVWIVNLWMYLFVNMCLLTVLTSWFS